MHKKTQSTWVMAPLYISYGWTQRKLHKTDNNRGTTKLSLNSSRCSYG